MDADSDSILSTPTAGEIQKDEKFWFEDGNIVLIAKDTVAFRVYRGVLARASPIFRDLFSVCRPDDGESMDGTPVVHLADRPSDLRAFLKFVIGPMPPECVLFPQICSPTPRKCHVPFHGTPEQ